MKKTILLVLSQVILLELVCQGAAYFLMPEQFEPPIAQEDAAFGWKFSGCRRQVVGGWGDFALCYNKQGLRHPRPLSSTIPLLITGNSVTLGQHVPLEKTFSAMVGGVNGGFEGYSIYQVGKRLTTDLLRQQKVQRLVLVVAPPDLITKTESETRVATTLRWNPMIRRTAPLLNLVRKEGIARLVIWRQATAAEPKQADKLILDDLQEKTRPEAWSDWSSEVLKIRDAVGSRHFALVLSPARSQVADFRAKKKEYARNLRIASFCQKNGIPMLDLLEIVATKDAKAVFLDPMHYTAVGHRAVSIAIKEFLAAQSSPGG